MLEGFKTAQNQTQLSESYCEMENSLAVCHCSEGKGMGSNSTPFFAPLVFFSAAFVCVVGGRIWF